MIQGIHNMHLIVLIETHDYFNRDPWQCRRELREGADVVIANGDSDSDGDTDANENT